VQAMTAMDIVICASTNSCRIGRPLRQDPVALTNAAFGEIEER